MHNHRDPDTIFAATTSLPSPLSPTKGVCFVGQWNGYLRKGRKTKPKRQNQTRNGKAGKRQSQSPSPSLKKSTGSQPKSTPKPKSQEK
ncbi:hypothetical protein Tco_1247329 [Tanacetum coccineum]